MIGGIAMKVKYIISISMVILFAGCNATYDIPSLYEMQQFNSVEKLQEWVDNTSIEMIGSQGYMERYNDTISIFTYMKGNGIPVPYIDGKQFVKLDDYNIYVTYEGYSLVGAGLHYPISYNIDSESKSLSLDIGIIPDNEQILSEQGLKNYLLNREYSPITFYEEPTKYKSKYGNATVLYTVTDKIEILNIGGENREIFIRTYENDDISKNQQIWMFIYDDFLIMLRDWNHKELLPKFNIHVI